MRSGWGGARHDPVLASRTECWPTMRPSTLSLARTGPGRAATPSGAPSLEACPPRPSSPAARCDLGGWWVSSRGAPLPGGALAAAERDRLNGSCSFARLCRFGPEDKRRHSSLRSQEMSFCPHRCPKIHAGNSLPPTPLVGGRAPRSGYKGREMRPRWRLTRIPKLGFRESPQGRLGRPGGSLVLERALNAREGGPENQQQ